MKGDLLFQHPTIVMELIRNVTPMEYVALRQTVPLFLRRPNLYPSAKEVALWSVERNVSAMRSEEFARVFANELRTKTCFALTGGSLLTALNGDEPQREQDYDICYVPAKPIDFDELVNRNFNDPLVALKYMPELEEIFKALSFNPQETITMDLTHVYPTTIESDRNTLTITITTASKFKIQFLVYSLGAHACKHILQFDLSFCSNALGAWGLFIGDIEAVQSRKCTVSIELYAKQKLHVIQHIGDPLIRDIVSGHVSSVVARVRKYEQRGYEIKVLHDPSATYDAIEGRILFLRMNEHPPASECICNIDISKYECYRNCIEKRKIQKTRANKLVISEAWNNAISVHFGGEKH